MEENCGGEGGWANQREGPEWEYRVWSIEYRERRDSKGAPWGNRMVGEGAHDRSMLSDFRSPFERMTRFRWRELPEIGMR